MLVNGMLCNSEVLYGLTNTHIETLESVDKYFWRKVFTSIISTPTDSYFLETNSIPIRFIVMGRRIMFYWTILQRSESEILSKVYNTQSLMPLKNDWYLQLESDLEECNITLTKEEIKCMKNERFKNLVLKKIKMLAKSYLISLRGSKSENLKHISSMKDYLKCENLTLEEKKLLFAMKTRSVNVKKKLSKHVFKNKHVLQAV